MITLSSDFGSPYPAAMKGVILSRCDARLIDVAHDFPRQDVRTAAFWLREVLPYFPPAVHLVVVDPGVGTDRSAVAIRAGGHALVGPDNGVLLPVARRLAGADADPECFEITYNVGRNCFEGDRTQSCDRFHNDLQPTLYDDPASVTFHGRDVFAPAAAEVHGVGVDRMNDLSMLTAGVDPVDLTFPDPSIGETGASGEVLVVDGFGNAITNVPGEVLEGRFGETVGIDGDPAPVERMYAAVPAGERLVTVGSHENVELAVNQGRGEEAFGVGTGDSVRIEW